MTPQKTSNNNSIEIERLSVQFSLNGLSFLCSNTNKEPLFYQEKLNQNSTPEELLVLLKASLSKKNIILDKVEKTQIHYASTLYTLVPKSLFDEKKSSDYLKFNSKILANDFIAHDVIDTLNLVVVYIPFVNINNFFFDAVGTFSYYHHITKLLEQSAKSYASKSERTTIVNVRDGQFDLIIYSDQKLQLCNSFSFVTNEDFIYYILFTFEQLKIDPATASIHVIGHQFSNSDLCIISEKYIKEVICLDGNFNEIKKDEAQHPTQLVLANIQ